MRSKTSSLLLMTEDIWLRNIGLIVSSDDRPVPLSPSSLAATRVEIVKPNLNHRRRSRPKPGTVRECPYSSLGWIKGSLTAMRKQHILTYGLSRSPTRAHFQNIPNTLRESVLCRIFRVQGDQGPLPVLVPVHDPGHNRVRIGARADDQEDHQKQ